VIFPDGPTEEHRIKGHHFSNLHRPEPEDLGDEPLFLGGDTAHFPLDEMEDRQESRSFFWISGRDLIDLAAE
jgi:hypothetical protein